jgi:phospholipase/carboxylesterase
MPLDASSTDAAPDYRVGWLGDPPPDGARVPTLVLLHGYGSNEQDLISLVPAMKMFLPTTTARVIAVRGSFSAPGRPRGYSWFPGSVVDQPSAPAIARVADGVADLVRRFTDRAVVLGFSQGMCTAITVLRRHPDLVDALVGLSGFMFDDDQPGDAALAANAAGGHGVPTFVGYDPNDPLIPAAANRWALTYLRTHTNLQEHSYPGMGHTVSLDEIADLARFLQRTLPI